MFSVIMLVTHFIISRDLFENRKYLDHVLIALVTVGFGYFIVWVLLSISCSAAVLGMVILIWWGSSHIILQSIKEEELLNKYLIGGRRR